MTKNLSQCEISVQKCMGRIPEETIQQVIEASDIVDIITGYVPDLKRAGTTFKACCPFHNERTPSFNVNPQRQYYKCFGCGEGGNVLSFVMKIENLTFPDALKKLAARANIPIHEEVEDPQAIAQRKSKTRLMELQNSLAEFLHELLLNSPDAEHAREYLKSRGFGSKMAKNWTVGWIPERPRDIIEWAKTHKFTPRELIDAGVAALRDMQSPSEGIYFRFRDRLMFPIRNDYGDVIGFSGRQLREDPKSGKYINSPETAVFKKSKVFFGLDKARKQIPKQGFALLCEGQLDVIACHERGFPYAIATQGTACTAEHVQILRRYTKHVALCYDADAAGQKATEKAFVECARAGLYVKVVIMPAGQDPDSLMQRDGEAAFQATIDDAREFFDYKIRYESSQRDLNNSSEKAELASQLAALLSCMTDSLQLQSSLSFVSTRLGITEQDLRVASRRKRQKPRTTRLQSQEEELEVITPTDLSDPVKTLCKLSLISKPAYDWCQAQFEAVYDAVEDEAGGSVVQFLLKTQPSPESNSQIMAYLETINEADKLALQPLYQSESIDDPVAAVEHVFRLISIRSVEKKLMKKRFDLGREILSEKELVQIQKDILDLQKFLSEIR